MGKSLKLGIILLVGLVVFGGGLYFFGRQEPDLSAYDRLKDPQVRDMPGLQQMLVVEAKGDPNMTSKLAFRMLYRAYFKTKPAQRIKGPVAPRARWPLGIDAPRGEWIGRFGLPVSDAVTHIPDAEPGELEGVTLQSWEYGRVAEILHKGPYTTERSDINRLLAYIASIGYEPAGEHEEEYLRGPGIMSPGDPEKYVTIIRYRIRIKG